MEPLPVDPDVADWLFRVALGRPPADGEAAGAGAGGLLALIANLRASPEAADERPDAGRVDALFRQLLGRPATASDVATLLGAGWSVRRIVDMLVQTEEFALRAPDLGAPYVNVHAPGLERFAHPRGTVSATGAVEVGDDGWLFLVGGTNRWLDQYVGDVRPDPGWIAGWQTVVGHREAAAAAAGARLLMLVVPEKLVLLPGRLGRVLDVRGPRPVERLLPALDGAVHYLHDVLAGVPEPFTRADSHPNLAGCLAIHAAILADLGREHDLRGCATEERFVFGDLGAHLRPQVGDVVPVLAGARAMPGPLREGVEAGRRRGTRQGWTNTAAPFPETVLVFGDSNMRSVRRRHTRVADLLAESFARVEFVSAPFGWDDGIVAEVAPDVVVVECTERFLVEVPPLVEDLRRPRPGPGDTSESTKAPR